MTRPKATEFDKLFGEKLREIRVKQRLTQAEIAEVLKTSMQQQNKREQGINRMPLSAVAVLRARYGISIDEIIDEILGDQPSQKAPSPITDALNLVEYIVFHGNDLLPGLRSTVRPDVTRRVNKSRNVS